jgi:hypothetical protein
MKILLSSLGMRSADQEWAPTQNNFQWPSAQKRIGAVEQTRRVRNVSNAELDSRMPSIFSKVFRGELRANREIADELFIDVARYKSNQDCAVLVCLIYDPLALLKNPRGFEKDLALHSDSRLQVLPIVSP